nr:alpha/beta hydrolases superfamily protein [Tanacetum cinerariifolium]
MKEFSCVKRQKKFGKQAKKESNNKEYSTSISEDEEYAIVVRDFKKVFKGRGRFVRQPRNDQKTSQRSRDDKNDKSDGKNFRCGDLNHLIGECPKLPKDKNQRAFVGGSWSDSGEEFEENGVTRPKKYSELLATKAIQADCDVKEINIVLQGLPPERECKLYDEFDKFAYKKGESLRDFYLRFLLLLNDMNIYNMKLEQFLVNTKFLNTLPLEWSKFVTDVMLVMDLHTTNVDQLHAYLGQHEYHANEFCLMHERTSDP